MKKERLLHLHYVLADCYVALRKLLLIDPELKYVYSFSPARLETQLGLSSKKASEVSSFLQKTTPSICIHQLRNQNIFYKTIWDEDYPQALREIYDPPFVLYGKGDSTILMLPNKLGAVGTRRPSLYGKNNIQSILQQPLQKGWITVSGFAAGIDTLIHEITVEAGCSTVAVLGHGLQYMYPTSNRSFYEKWQEQILLITEYPPHYAPRKWYFPKRNRIISGLSKGVLVIEAKARSGSLITAECALEQNREVFALPGPIFTEGAAGTNLLIQQGAKLIMSSADILEELLIE
ncbi:DNA-processing protein DprA [Bacillus manliponensis]|uniref:DNA-processing protein DprA n=1 Tax=Bacillus manliponensis TaxID=574376 RepID=UPI0035121D42